MNVTGLCWWQINIGSGNGSLPSGSKPLPEPMLTQIFVTIGHHWAKMHLQNNPDFKIRYTAASGPVSEHKGIYREYYEHNWPRDNGTPWYL